MQYYKDKKNKPHAVNDERSLPQHLKPFTKITEAQAKALAVPPPETPAKANARKDAQVNAELGGDNIRILVSVFKEVIADGTIASKTPAEIVAQAMTKRRAELP